jgi:alkylation response protein AidB-like acyl-CoA dehydrogenase
MRFLLHEVLTGSTGAEGDADLFNSVLEEAARVVEGSIAPTNAPADRDGATLGPDGVVMPKALHEAYRPWRDGEWTGLSLDPDHGGQGLPRVLDTMVTEMTCGGGLSFSVLPGLTRGAWKAIHAHASDDLKRAWLPRMATGEWTGAMALTEPQAGTDLGLLRTRAVPDGEAFRLSGSKMFITAADHDLTENIVHLVLARLPDAPPGTRGISLFLVPKILPDGTRNAWAVSALEDKMGLHASPTCVVNYEGATGWMVGPPNRGLAAMFTMMNDERLFVGIQGIGAGEAALQIAEGYAEERLQGRAPGGPARPDLPADPIIHHPDVRRMVMTGRALTEGGRALAAWLAIQIDRAEFLPDGPDREEANDLVALLTPVLKASGTDFGFETCVAAQQVLGGHGYLRDWGLEQWVRDVRISQIYEGTNGIQALDLVNRKLPMKGGAAVQRFLDLVAVDRAGMAPPFSATVDRLVVATETACRLVAEATSEEAVAEAATDILHLFALLAHGWMWGRMDAAAARGTEPFHAAKRETAKTFLRRVAPDAETLLARISIVLKPRQT